MKKIIAFITLSIILSSCDFDKLTTIQDDFVVTVNAEPVLSKVNLQIFDANGGRDIAPKITINFEGENADQIYAINGSKTFNVDNGFITVGVNTNYPVSIENPLTVSAIVSADGYISKVRDITFDGEDIREEQISLLKRDDLPETITLKSVTKPLIDNKTTEEIVVEVNSNSGVENILQFAIPEGTEFEDEDGNIVSGGEVTIDVQTFDIEEPDIELLTEDNSNPEQMPSGVNEFPGSFELDAPTSSKSFASKQEVLSNGTYLVPITRQPCLKIYVNGRIVYNRGRQTVTGPKVTSLIYASTINPNTNQKIKLGDIIAVYRKVGNGNVKLTDVTVQSYPWSSGYFQITFNIPGSGVYPYGFEVTPSCQQITAPINFVNNGRRAFYFYRVAHKSNPKRALRWGYMYFNGIYQVNTSNIGWWPNRGLNSLKEDMVLKIYNYSYQEGRYKTVYNEEVSKCELSGQTIDISNTDCFIERDMDLTLECPDATYILNNVYVYYKPENGGYWSYFDRVLNSKLTGKSPCLDDGVKYEFGFWYNGWRVTPPLTETQMIDLYENFDLNAICPEIRNNF